MATLPQDFLSDVKTTRKFLRASDFAQPQILTFLGVERRFNNHPAIRADQWVYSFRDENGDVVEVSTSLTAKGLKIALLRAGAINEETGEIVEKKLKIWKTGERRETRWYAEEV
jgi:hypothetical protein